MVLYKPFNIFIYEKNIICGGDICFDLFVIM